MAYDERRYLASLAKRNSPLATVTILRNLCGYLVNTVVKGDKQTIDRLTQISVLEIYAGLRDDTYWMDDADRNTPGMTCSRCGTLADAGRIFCGKCEAALQFPAPLIPPSHNINAHSVSPIKQKVVIVLKYLAAMSAVVFWLCPLRSGIQVLVFVASIAVLLICHFAVSRMDETYANKNAGYWPKLVNWTRSSESDDANGKR